MTREEAIKRLSTIFVHCDVDQCEDYNCDDCNETVCMAIKALEQDDNGKENRNARIIYDFLKIKIGSKIIDNPFEFEDWYNRMVWHVQECYKLQKKYKGGETAEPKRGKWIVDRYCSECEWDKKEAGFTSGWRENYCPNCGTRMESDSGSIKNGQ